MIEERESIVAALFQSYLVLLLSRGVPDAQAQDMAKRCVHNLLDIHGGRKVYLPRTASFEADARAGRDEAIRQARARNVPRRVILRTFRISKTQFYRILAA